ncbi:extracellular solute-binding protein [Alkalicoccus daliensis]|uniref:Carbohydrate ABC transporter substrate-binding protein, CUT1 family n=1 Tax=Alkalicoccus daliensis TaxID=745820 RepID=A0A1H0KBU7_9BACI|nr:extracellular solute-binding protein [Alkalicoccus daliensis]SDO53251.1 carbohydrate ABC transporter substrate-binding protein, CUT1 family [Alkalicoccus daliensis]
MKKYFGLTSVAALFVLAACGGDNADGNNGGNDDGNANNSNAEAANNEGEEAANNNSGASEDQIELNFWLFGATGYPDLAEQYMEENPDIYINFQEIDMEDHHNNLFTALSAGSGAPDMAAVEVAEIERYRGAEDRFYNLNELGAEEMEDQYLDWVWEIGQDPESDYLFGLPTDIGPTVMFYQANIFEEAGLDSDPESVEEMLTDWDEYEEAAAQIYDATGLPMVDSPETIFNALRDQSEQLYFNEEGDFILPENEDLREAYDFTTEMIEAGYVGGYEMWTPEWGSGMSDGSYATLPAPAWMQGVIKDNAPDHEDWRIASLPEGAGNWGGSWITIPEQSEHPEEAYAFLNWLLSPEQQLEAFENMGLFPSAPEVYEMEEFQNYTDDYFGGQETASIFANAAEEVEHTYTGPNYTAANDEMIDALFNVFDGADPDQEWDDMIQRIEQRIDR